MNRKLYYGLLLAEAVILAVLCVLQASVGRWFVSAAAFPFEQLGLGLRALSLSGEAGNGAAIVVYVLAGAVPAAFFAAAAIKNRKCRPEDWLLALLSGVTFLVLYWMINPGLLYGLDDAVWKAVLGGTWYSVLLAWLVLRLVALIRNGQPRQLEPCLRWLLGLLGAYFTAKVFGEAFGDWMEQCREFRFSVRALGCYGLGFLVKALPPAMALWVVDGCLRLTEQTPHSPEQILAAERLETRCCRMLAISVLTVACGNVAQVLLIQWLPAVNGRLTVPLFELALAVVALLVTRLLRQNKELKDDNDLFV